MIFAIIRYILSAIIDMLADIAAFILAPVAALFVITKDGREYLTPFWQWTTTHDAPVDAGRVDKYFTVPDTKWGRYIDETPTIVVCWHLESVLLKNTRSIPWLPFVKT